MRTVCLTHTKPNQAFLWAQRGMWSEERCSSWKRICVWKTKLLQISQPPYHYPLKADSGQSNFLCRYLTLKNHIFNFKKWIRVKWYIKKSRGIEVTMSFSLCLTSASSSARDAGCLQAVVEMSCPSSSESAPKDVDIRNSEWCWNKWVSSKGWLPPI